MAIHKSGAQPPRKALVVTVVVRNNQLKERRDETGLSQPDFAELLGVPVGLYRDLECLKRPPWDWRRSRARGEPGHFEEGCWSDVALQIAAYHGEAPEVLWPAETCAVQQPVQVVKIDGPELRPLLARHEREVRRLRQTSPDEAAEAGETREQMRDLLDTLPVISRRVLELRFDDDATLEEVGRQLHAEGLTGGHLSNERVRQMEARALSKMRSGVRGDVAEALHQGRPAPPNTPERLTALKGKVEEAATARQRKAEQLAAAWEDHRNGIMQLLWKRYRAVKVKPGAARDQAALFDSRYDLRGLGFRLRRAALRSTNNTLRCPHCRSVLEGPGLNAFYCVACGWCAEVYW